MASKEDFFEAVYDESSEDDAEYHHVFDSLRGTGTYGRRGNSLSLEIYDLTQGCEIKKSNETPGRASTSQKRPLPQGVRRVGVRGKPGCSHEHHRLGAGESASPEALAIERILAPGIANEDLLIANQEQAAPQCTEYGSERKVAQLPATTRIFSTMKDQFFNDVYDQNGGGNRIQQAGTKHEKYMALRSGTSTSTKSSSSILDRKLRTAHKTSLRNRSLRTKSEPLDHRHYLNTNGLGTRAPVSRKNNLAEERMSGSGKSNKRTVQLPESQRIFKDQIFCETDRLFDYALLLTMCPDFVPNSDVSRARRFRIQKAVERGADWVKEWGGHVTHVIADKALNLEDVLKYLGIAAIPSGIVLVNENYPADCIAYQSLVNPIQIQYAVQRLEPALAPIQSLQGVSPFVLRSTPLKSIRNANGATPSPSLRDEELAAAHQIEIKMKAYRLRKTTGRRENTLGELNEAINEAREFQDLPLGESEDEETFTQDQDLPEDEARIQTLKASSIFNPSLKNEWQQNFVCMQEHDGRPDKDRPNSHTIEILQKMADYYDRAKDQWRVLAYRKAIAALRKQPKQISTKKEGMVIPFIGERIAEKIEEIVCTAGLRRLDNTAGERYHEVLQTFLKIYGVGCRQAYAWISQGHRTLEDLENKASLTKNQAIGIAHYKDFQTRIPREEVGRHGSLVREVLEKIDPRMIVLIGGSYRRGAQECGDVDFIITAEDMPITAMRTRLLNELIPRLYAAQYLKCGLAVTSSGSGTKWHGAASMPGSPPGIWRRVDFLLVPPEEYGAALLYFTGNDIFNRSIRLLASKKGMRLNQRGLWKDVLRGLGRVKVCEGALLEGRSEKRIFELLGVPWRQPEYRNC